jgi:hypothetical protein
MEILLSPFINMVKVSRTRNKNFVVLLKQKWKRVYSLVLRSRSWSETTFFDAKEEYGMPLNSDEKFFRQSSITQLLRWASWGLQRIGGVCLICLKIYFLHSHMDSHFLWGERWTWIANQQ